MSGRALGQPIPSKVLGSWLPWQSCLPKFRNTPALGSLLMPPFLTQFFFPFVSNVALGQVWKQRDHHPTFGILCPKQPLLCFHVVTQGHLKNGQLYKLRFAEGSHRAPAGREPPHAREDPGGSGHVAPGIMCHRTWSREGFVKDSSWTDFLLLCGWWSGH